MEHYVRQLLADIRQAKDNVPAPWWQLLDVDEEEDFFPSASEDANYVPRKSLEELTGLHQEQLPPATRLTSLQTHRLLEALKELLSACNCHVVFQRAGVPESMQYEIIRLRFDQDVPQLHAADHFFSFCDPNQDRNTCPLGEFCECQFLDHMLAHFDEEQEAEEGGDAEEFDFHEYYMRRKYGRDWERHEGFIDWDESDEDYLDEEDFWDGEEQEEGEE